MTTRQKQKNKLQASNRDYYDSLGGRRTSSLGDEKWKLLDMNFGAERREKLKEWFKTNTLTVNRKWCILLKYDPDLRRMLKQGILKRSREGTFGTNYTILSLA